CSQPGDRFALSDPFAGKGEDAHEESSERALDPHGPSGPVDGADHLTSLDDLALGRDRLGWKRGERAGGGGDDDPFEDVEVFAGEDRVDRAAHAGTGASSVATSGRALRARPVSTRPGPTSTNVSAPRSTKASSDCRHNTGRTRCSTRRARHPSASVHAAASAFDTTGADGGRSSTSDSASARASAAGCMSGVWNAPSTSRRTTLRTPAVRAASVAASRPGSVPAITN